MLVIADISVPADAFPLGQVLENYPEVEIELERLVPLREAIIPLFWIEGGDQAAIQATLEDDPLTNSVKQLTTADDRHLYEVEWAPDIGGLIQIFLDTDAQLLQAEGTARVWDFRLQFLKRADLIAFREACEAAGIQITLRRLYNPTLPEDDSGLTENQYEALIAAYENGYFQVPRSVSMDDLASEFGISDSALSQRIRRGTAALIAETIATDF
jgi:predicted DNA binding protein